MGVYSLDRSSPKKGVSMRSGFSDVRRKLTSRKYFCLWILMAVVPCYLLRQIFFYQSPSSAAYIRNQGEGHLATSTAKTLPYEKPTGVLEKTTGVNEKPIGVQEKPKGVEEKPTEVGEKPAKVHEKPPGAAKPVEEKSVLDFIFKPRTIKPAKYDKAHSAGGSTTTQDGIPNSLKLKLKDNFEDDEDFGVAEDNDKAAEQMWTAPPTPSTTKEKTISGR